MADSTDVSVNPAGITEVEAQRYALESLFNRLLFPQHDNDAKTLEADVNEWLKQTAYLMIRENHSNAIDNVVTRWADALRGNIKIRITVDFHAREGW